MAQELANGESIVCLALTQVGKHRIDDDQVDWIGLLLLADLLYLSQPFIQFGYEFLPVMVVRGHENIVSRADFSLGKVISSPLATPWDMWIRSLVVLGLH